MSTDADLMSVAEFAARFRVDASEVRRWIKTGAISYELVGPRKMRRIRKSLVVVPIEPSDPVNGFEHLQIASDRSGVNDERPRSEDVATVRDGAPETTARRDEDSIGRPAPVTSVEGRDRGTTPSTSTSKGRGRR